MAALDDALARPGMVLLVLVFGVAESLLAWRKPAADYQHARARGIYGGRLRAGPGAGRVGWSVEAELPFDPPLDLPARASEAS